MIHTPIYPHGRLLISIMFYVIAAPMNYVIAAQMICVIAPQMICVIPADDLFDLFRRQFDRIMYYIN